MKRLCFILFICLIQSANAFEYKDYDHDFADKAKDQLIVFSGHLVGYLITQRDVIEEEGSFQKMERNLFDFHFDNDNVNWNYAGHIYTGSQVYLYYRARGYSQHESFYLSFLSSLWFELFIETYTERPSIQDMFNTPIYGSTLGFAIEKISTSLSKSDNSFNRGLAVIMNPFSLLIKDNKDISFFHYTEGKGDYQFRLVFNYD